MGTRLWCEPRPKPNQTPPLGPFRGYSCIPYLKGWIVALSPYKIIILSNKRIPK